MSAKSTINTEWNILLITSQAGSVDFSIIEEDQLFCKDIDQSALDAAITAYDHPAEIENQLGNAERLWRNSELQRSDIETFKAEDIAGAFDAETWRSYRVALRAWPESVDFPDSTKRPIAPDAV